TPFRPTPRHPTTAQQTSGTADCSRAAPSTAAPSAPNRTPATAEREATAQAGSTAGQVERRAFQIPATVPPAPHPRSAGSTATDDLLEPAPRSSRSRTAHRSSHPNRASDVPHISSRSADYTPTPGPIERLFPHPASELRRSSSAVGEQTGTEGITLMLPYAPPYDWDAMIGFLAARAITGIEAVDGSKRYRRSIALEGAQGAISVEPDERERGLRVTIR